MRTLTLLEKQKNPTPKTPIKKIYFWEDVFIIGGGAVFINRGKGLCARATRTMRHPECCAEDWRPSQKLRSVQGLVGRSVHGPPRRRPAGVLPGAYAMCQRLKALVGMREGKQ